MSARDRFITVENGKLVLNEENDGWAYQNRGPESSAQSTTLKELKNTSLYDQAVGSLKSSIPRRYKIIKTAAKEYDVTEHLKPQELEQFAELSARLQSVRDSVKAQIFKKKQ